MACDINVQGSVLNSITSLNLNPIFISLQGLAYKFLRNKSSEMNRMDEEIEFVNNEISTVDDAIKEAESGKQIDIEELRSLNVDTDGCSVSDKNRRKQNVIDSLSDRKSELEDEKNNLEEQRTRTQTLYDSLLNGILGIIQRLITLLQNIVQSVGAAIGIIEGAMLASSAFIVGVSSAFSLGFIQNMLQNKIFTPVCNTVSQQVRYGTPSQGDFLPDV